MHDRNPLELLELVELLDLVALLEMVELLESVELEELEELEQFSSFTYIYIFTETNIRMDSPGVVIEWPFFSFFSSLGPHLRRCRCFVDKTEARLAPFV